MPTVVLDTSKFEAAIKYVFDNTRRTLPEIINRAALVTIIGGKGVDGAMQRTRRATQDAILSVPASAVASYVMKRHAGQHLTRKQITQLIKKEYKRRIAAIGYTAVAGWAKAARDLGGKIKVRKGKGYASMGYGKPASYGDYEAVIVNTAPAAEKIGTQALQDAMNDAAADMVKFWEQKTGVIFRP